MAVMGHSSYSGLTVSVKGGLGMEDKHKQLIDEFWKDAAEEEERLKEARVYLDTQLPGWREW